MASSGGRHADGFTELGGDRLLLHVLVGDGHRACRR